MPKKKKERKKDGGYKLECNICDICKGRYGNEIYRKKSEDFIMCIVWEDYFH